MGLTAMYYTVYAEADYGDRLVLGRVGVEQTLALVSDDAALPERFPDRSTAISALKLALASFTRDGDQCDSLEVHGVEEAQEIWHL